MGLVSSIFCGDGRDVNHSPAEYVKYNRKIEFDRMMQMIGDTTSQQEGVKSTEEMTVDELKAHYAQSGKDKWDQMSEAEKLLMQKRIDVSLCFGVASFTLSEQSGVLTSISFIGLQSI